MSVGLAWKSAAKSNEKLVNQKYVTLFLSWRPFNALLNCSALWNFSSSKMFHCIVAHGNSGGFLSSSTTILLSESLKRDSSIEKSAERWEVGGQVGQDKEHSTSFSQGACQSTLCSKLYIPSYI